MSSIKESLRNSSFAQRIGYVLGATYLVVGIAGFAVTGGVGFFATSGKPLIAFDLNPAHNIVHLLIGVALIGAARARDNVSRGVSTVIGAVYLLVGIAGLFIVGKGINILALNHADNGLHIASAAVLLVTGLGLIGRRKSADDTSVADVEPTASITQVATPARSAATTSPRVSAGSTVAKGGVYRCSCHQFAVLLEAGGTLPTCTVGRGHSYRYAGRPRSKSRAS